MTARQKNAEELSAKRAQLDEIGKKVREGDTSDATMSDLRAKNAEVNALWDKAKAFDDAERISAENDAQTKEMNKPASSTAQGNGGNIQAEHKSLGEAFTDSTGFKNAGKGSKKGLSVDIDYDVKTLMTTINGFAPENPRTGRIVPMAQQRPTIASLIPTITTSSSSLTYMEEVIYDNQVTATAEGAALVESGLRLNEASNPVQKIGTYLPVSDEQLEDVPGIQNLINNRLMLMLQQKEENYLLNGTGLGSEITGFFAKPTLLAEPLVAPDTRIDVIRKAITKIETAGGTVSYAAIASAIVMHPLRWDSIVLEKDLNGRYIIGDPQISMAQMRLWGVPVILSSSVAVNTALVGDFQMFSQISRRTGINIEVGMINDQFIQGVQCVKITERIALEIYRGAAFCRVTNF